MTKANKKSTDTETTTKKKKKVIKKKKEKVSTETKGRDTRVDKNEETKTLITASTPTKPPTKASDDGRISISDESLVRTPVKRQIYLWVFPYEAPQGLADVDKLCKEYGAIRKEIFGRRRPSLKEGWWKLTTGDWAKREGAIFIKNSEGHWIEVKMTPGQNDIQKMGLRPVTEFKEKKRQEVFDEEPKESLT